MAHLAGAATGMPKAGSSLDRHHPSSASAAVDRPFISIHPVKQFWYGYINGIYNINEDGPRWDLLYQLYSWPKICVSEVHDALLKGFH